MTEVKVFLVVWMVVCIDATPLPTTPPTTPALSTTKPPNTTQWVDKIIEERIDSSIYNCRVRPGYDGEPIDVYIGMKVNDISYISEKQMEYSMTLSVRELWKDERLAYADTGRDRNITLNYNQFDRIWTPDLYIVNLKSGVFHQTTVPNREIRLSPNGQVYYSQRHTVTLYCDMLLERFPMDNQTCFIQLSSYAYSTDDMIFHWRVDEVAVELIRVSLPEYTITNTTMEVCTPSEPASLLCLRAYFHLSRRLNMYILNTYLPSFLVVLLSWMSFYIDPDSTPARTSLGITSVLVITTQNSGLIDRLPSGSITKASDVWMATCLVFVFGAFIEYAVVNQLKRRSKQKKVYAVSLKALETNDMNGSVGEKRSRGRLGVFCCLLNYKEDPAMALEQASRILFPFTFFIFCCFYWPMYLIG